MATDTAAARDRRLIDLLAREVNAADIRIGDLEAEIRARRELLSIALEQLAAAFRKIERYQIQSIAFRDELRRLRELIDGCPAKQSARAA